MSNDQIKNQLLYFNRQFKQNAGLFKSFEIVFDYINVLTSEPYIVEVLTPLFKYLEEQTKIPMNEEIVNYSVDFSEANSFSKIPIFSQEFKELQGYINNKKEPQLMLLLPLYFTVLSGVAYSIDQIKNYQKLGNIEQANKLIEEVKEKSLSTVDLSMIKGFEDKRITYGKLIDMSIELVNKFIIDEIDAQALLQSSKPMKPIDFDEDKSALYIRGQEIKITRRGDPSIQHYTLKALGKDNFTELVDFSDISENYLKEEYDGERDWGKFRHTCIKLNKKIFDKIKMDDFIEYTNGKTGWCKINQKYL